MIEQKGPYQLISSREVYKNPWLQLREDRVIRPGGTQGVFGVIVMKVGSTVLALDRQRQAYIVREYKYGIERESLELMSGAIEDGETPLDAAKRELMEELGLEAEEWIDMGVVDPFTTIVRSPNHMFLALAVRQRTQHLEEGEMLQVLRTPFEDLVEMVMQSKVTHSASCVLVLKAEKYLRSRRQRE